MKLWLLAMLLFLGAGTSSADQPNILFVFCDDCSPAQFAVYAEGSLTLQTQTNLDALAAEGVTFNNMWASAPVCAPTRLSMLAGVRNFRFGRGSYTGTNPVPVEFNYLPRKLVAAGYETHAVGKWQISGTDGSKPYDPATDDCATAETWRAPIRMGFQTAWIDHCQLHIPLDWTTEGYDIWTEAGYQGNTVGYYEEGAKDHILSIINTSASRPPWFIYWGPPGVHSPDHTPPNSLCPGGNCATANCQPFRKDCAIYAFDQLLGEIRTAITNSGEEAVIIFVGDNAAIASTVAASGVYSSDPPGTDNHGKNGPFPSSLRVPAIIGGNWAGITADGDTTQALAETRDLHSTILAMAEAPTLEGSESLVGLLTDSTGTPRAIQMGGRIRNTDNQVHGSVSNGLGEYPAQGTWVTLGTRGSFSPNATFRTAGSLVAMANMDAQDLTDGRVEVLCQ